MTALRKTLGKCSKCGAPLYEDQDGYIYPTLNSGGQWHKGPVSQWDWTEYWWHRCDPNDPSTRGTLKLDI